MREYTIYITLPAPTDEADDANIDRIDRALQAAHFQGDQYAFGDTFDLDDEEV